MLVGLNNKKINIPVKERGVLGRIRGLMFRKKENAPCLLFNLKKLVRIPLHSLFVFFPFLVLWLDDKNNIIQSEIVKPFRFNIIPEKKFFRIIEIPLNSNYSSITKQFN